MQTNAVAISILPAPAGPSAGQSDVPGEPGSAAGAIFAALVQGSTMQAKAPAGAPVAAGVRPDAAAGDGEPQPSESTSGDEAFAVLQVQCLQLPVPPLAGMGTSPAGAATSSPADAVLQAANPADAIAEGASPPAAVTGSLAAEGDAAAAPPSVQAVDLAKVLGAGTQVHVSRAPVDPAPVPPLGLAVAEALAAVADEGALAPVVDPLVRSTAAGARTTEMPAGVTASSAAAHADQATTARHHPAPELAANGRAAVRKQAEAPTPLASTAGTATSGATPAVLAPASGAVSPADADAAGEVGGDSMSTDAAKPTTGRDGQAAPPAQPLPPASNAAPFATTVAQRGTASGFAAPPPAGQVSVHIAKAVRAGVDRINIQLSPASLGRVEIRLDLSDQHQVRASISAETKEALELLRADVRVLERALQDVGLKTDPGSLSFQLRDHGARAGHDGGGRQDYGPPAGRQAETEDAAANPAAQAPARTAMPAAVVGAGRIDIHA